jgi:competence protein CoiA
MIWASIDNEKVEATPSRKGICPHCKGKVRSRCGDVNAWHWAHFEGENCDPWYEPESYWHIHWKLTFGKDNAECRIEKNNKWHIADILTNENVVIELQNSPIQKPVIREREEFYGERMLWVINGHCFKENFTIKDFDNLWLPWIKRHNLPIEKTKEKVFEWSWARKSWSDVQRHVLIDFEEESLFMVKVGMGTKRGKGIYVSKEAFIKKYGGNYEYYRNLSASLSKAKEMEKPENP